MVNRKMLLSAIILGGASVVALVAGLTSSKGLLAKAHAGESSLGEKECSVATLQGEYLITGRGDSRSDLPNPALPLVFAGVRTFDGAGNLSQVETVSIGGRIVRGQVDTGTYSLDSNCIGEMTVATRTFDIFVARDGGEGVAIGTNDGAIGLHTFKQR